MGTARRVAKRILRYYGVFVLLAGIVIVGGTAQSSLRKGRIVEQSVPVEATIEHASVEVHELGNPDEYEPHVTYRYTYEGETYTSTSLHPGTDKDRFTARRAAEKQADYSEGETVTAHVLPSAPETAYLTRHPGRDGVGFIAAYVVGGLFVLVGGFSTGLKALAFVLDVDESDGEG